MPNPVFFDAACRVGKNSLGDGVDVPALLQEMDRCGVAKALVRDLDLGVLGAVKSNARLSEMLNAGDPDHRLYGVWCLLPENCGELLPPAEFFNAMAAGNIRALTLKPVEHRWIPGRLTIQNYMAEARARRIPILLDGFGEDWERIQRFLEEFPDNTFISLENEWKWSLERKFRPLMDAFPNLYFSIDGYWTPEGIPELVRRYGAGRLLFGSRYPSYYAGSAMLQLKQAGLRDEDLAQIASGNLEQLLKGAAR